MVVVPRVSGSMAEVVSHSTQHLTDCYLKHQQDVFEYFQNRTDFLSINISHTDSLPNLLSFLGLAVKENNEFPHLNIGRHVASWKEFKHPNKVNANSAGLERRKFFDYK